MGLIVNLILAVYTISPILTMTSNPLVNFPLHWTHLRMLRRDKPLSSKNDSHNTKYLESQQTINQLKHQDTVNATGKNQCWRRAIRKTFHPFIIYIAAPFGGFCVIAMAWILHTVAQLNPTLGWSAPTTLVAGVSTGSWWWYEDPVMRQRVLISVMWLNLALNHAPGFFGTLVYATCQCCRRKQMNT